jgi:hypothetical protein
MPEKMTSKGAIQPMPKRIQMPNVVVASRFSIRTERILADYVDLLFEPVEKGLPVAKVTFDFIIFKTNLEAFKQFAVGLNVNERDDALGDNIPFTQGGAYANIMHMTHTGGRAETAFGIVSLSEWVQAGARAAKGSVESVEAVDTLTVYSDAAFQKKFLLELILTIEKAKK